MAKTPKYYGSTSKSIPSNIRQHRALVYSDNTKLEQDILEELIAKYELNDCIWRKENEGR